MRPLPAGRRAAAGECGALRRLARSRSANRPFLLFSLAMIGSYVLSFQVYLALPLETRRLAPSGDGGHGRGRGAVRGVRRVAIVRSSGHRLVPGQVVAGGACRRDRVMAAPSSCRWPPHGRGGSAGRPLIVSAALLASARPWCSRSKWTPSCDLADEYRCVATHYGSQRVVGDRDPAGRPRSGAVFDLSAREQLAGGAVTRLVVIGLLCAGQACDA